MVVETLPWPEAYRPKSLNQLVGNSESVKRLQEWLLSWKTKIPSKKAVLLLGPPGVGKTASVGALSNDLNAELVEFNASDKRNKGIIETKVWLAATQQTLDESFRIILLDEVDGLSGTSDRGGVGAILKVINDAVHPIVMTANNPESPRLKDLFKICLIITYELLETADMLHVLKYILSNQELQLDDSVLRDIIENSGGDLRAAISDLEILVLGNLQGEERPSLRDTRHNIEEMLRRLFMTTDSETARQIVSNADVDHDQILLWLEENLHLHFLTLEELDTGLNAISLADLTLGRIMRRQNWKMLSYAYDFLSSGISTSRTQTPYRLVEYSRPTWPLLVWQGNRRREKSIELQSRLSEIAKVSRSRVIDTHQSAVEKIAKKDPSSKDAIANWLKIRKGLLDRRSSR